MGDALLASYFDEHLAGAGAAIEITERLRDDDAMQSIVKRTVRLMGGILAQVRERSPLASPPSRMEDLEALAVGIWGKRLLWGTVARLALHDDRFGGLDVATLARRAEEQEKTVLRLRDDAAESELELARDG